MVLLLYTLSHVEPSGNAPVRQGYNESTLQLAMAACHDQRPNRNYLTKTSIKLRKNEECMSQFRILRLYFIDVSMEFELIGVVSCMSY
jgi:hypothetical protein